MFLCATIFAKLPEDVGALDVFCIVLFITVILVIDVFVNVMSITAPVHEETERKTENQVERLV